MPLDLDAIKTRLDAATPGPWAQHPEVPRSIVSAGKPDFSLLALDAPPEDGPYAVVDSEGDADLIAHAPTDIAALVAEIERLRATMTQIAEEFRGDLWVNDDDFRGHEYYERILDALADGEVSGG